MCLTMCANNRRAAPACSAFFSVENPGIRYDFAPCPAPPHQKASTTPSTISTRTGGRCLLQHPCRLLAQLAVQVTAGQGAGETIARATFSWISLLLRAGEKSPSSTVCNAELTGLISSAR